MFFRRYSALALAAMLALSLPAVSGCSSRTGGYDYSAAEARQAYSVHHATVIRVQPVTIHGDSSTQQSLGGVLGSVAGGFIGSTIGSGTGRTLAAVGGALLGGTLGVGAGSLAAQETGQQITLRYDDGHEELVVQGAEPPLQAGQPVRVIIGADGSRRVEPAY